MRALRAALLLLAGALFGSLLVVGVVGLVPGETPRRERVVSPVRAGLAVSAKPDLVPEAEPEPQVPVAGEPTAVTTASEASFVEPTPDGPRALPRFEMLREAVLAGRLDEQPPSTQRSVAEALVAEIVAGEPADERLRVLERIRASAREDALLDFLARGPRGEVAADVVALVGSAPGPWFHRSVLDRAERLPADDPGRLWLVAASARASAVHEPTGEERERLLALLPGGERGGELRRVLVPGRRR